jgi:hypothetical protein
MPSVAAKESPLLAANVPKIMPKGTAPTTSGTIAFIPAQNSDLGEDSPFLKAAFCELTIAKTSE